MNAAAGTQPESLLFKTSQGLTLAYDLYRGGHQNLVVVSHGFMCHRRLPELTHLAQHLSTFVDVAVLDCRGHGDSDGAFSFGLYEWQDLSEFVDKIRLPYRKTAGVGFSFGGFHTCVAAAESQIFDSVVLISTPKNLWIFDHNFLSQKLVESLPHIRKRQRRRARLGWNFARGTTPLSRAHQIQKPVLVVHGQNDWLIDVKHARLLFEKLQTPQKRISILPGGMHAEYLMAQMPDKLLPLLDDWLHTTLVQVGSAG